MNSRIDTHIEQSGVPSEARPWLVTLMHRLTSGIDEPYIYPLDLDEPPAGVVCEWVGGAWGVVLKIFTQTHHARAFAVRYGTDELHELEGDLPGLEEQLENFLRQHRSRASGEV